MINHNFTSINDITRMEKGELEKYLISDWESGCIEFNNVNDIEYLIIHKFKKRTKIITHTYDFFNEHNNYLPRVAKIESIIEIINLEFDKSFSEFYFYDGEELFKDIIQKPIKKEMMTMPL